MFELVLHSLTVSTSQNIRNFKTCLPRNTPQWIEMRRFVAPDNYLLFTQNIKSAQNTEEYKYVHFPSDYFEA